MADIEIVIAQQPDGTAAPQSGPKETIRTGQSVLFRPEKGATGGRVKFRGRSPFNVKEAAYPSEMAVTATFTKGNDAANRFEYECELEKGGKTFKSKNGVGGGGEFELVSGDN
jgi:hypothetical protein